MASIETTVNKEREETVKIELPVQIGDVLWMAQTQPVEVTVKCSVCCGRGSVWIINSEGDEFNVRCEACGLGFDAPRGIEKSWSYEPRALPFEVGEVTRWEIRDGVWTIHLRSQSGLYGEFSQLYPTEADALEASKKRMAEIVEQNIASSVRRRKSSLSSHTWSARYHNQEIEALEKKIALHKTRLLSKKKGKTL